MYWGTVMVGTRSIKVALYYWDICVEFLFMLMHGVVTINLL